MTILHWPAAAAMAWLLAVAIGGAGVGNAVGGASVQAEFVRWGYPAWWNFVTAALELFGAVLIAVPQTRLGGLALIAVILIAAIVTLVWRREYRHVPPALALAVLTGVELVLVAIR